MIWIILSFPAGVAGALLIYFGYGWLRHREDVRLVETKLAESAARANAEKDALPNHERELTKEERDEVLRRIAAFGDRKL